MALKVKAKEQLMKVGKGWFYLFFPFFFSHL